VEIRLEDRLFPVGDRVGERPVRRRFRVGVGVDDREPAEGAAVAAVDLRGQQLSEPLIEATADCLSSPASTTASRTRSKVDRSRSTDSSGTNPSGISTSPGSKVASSRPSERRSSPSPAATSTSRFAWSGENQSRSRERATTKALSPISRDPSPRNGAATVVRRLMWGGCPRRRK